jgi:hypothetical protein
MNGKRRGKKSGNTKGNEPGPFGQRLRAASIIHQRPAHDPEGSEKAGQRIEGLERP